MSAQVCTVWPTFIDDMGKDPKFLVLWPGDHVPSWGSGGERWFASRADAKAHANILNAVRSDDWIAR